MDRNCQFSSLNPDRDSSPANPVGFSRESSRGRQIEGNDEVATLANGFNQMATQLELRDRTIDQQMEKLKESLKKIQQMPQLIQTEKMSSLGQLVAGVAHEINNPVSFIHGNLPHAHEYIDDLLYLIEIYQQHYPNPVAEINDAVEAIDLAFLKQDLPKLLNSMTDGTDRIREIVLSLRNFSRMDEAACKAVDIHEGIDSTLVILRDRYKEKQEQSPIDIIKKYGCLPLVECYAGQLNQVFMNILTNAIDALQSVSSEATDSQKPKTITIRTRSFPNQDSPEIVRIQIQDNGPGIPEEVKTCIFDPFFTTKPVGEGTGLGLSISYQIVVEKHQGILSCHADPELGTEFIIDIPVHQNPASQNQQPSKEKVPTSAILSTVQTPMSNP